MPETELHVEFDQPQEVFFPGKPITGRVILTTAQKYKARAVSIKFEGNAHTNWEDTETVARADAEGNNRNEQKKVNYSAKVNYLNNTSLLWVCRDGSNELAPGKYVWPFSYVLPGNIPPSFEGKYGYIRYSATAEVDRPWRFDKAKKRCITVSPLLDLNAIPYAIAPLKDQASENVGCCCFKKGYLEMRVDIPKMGFVPGETVPINIHFINHSTVPVKEVRAKIIQTCKFVAFKNGCTFNYSDSQMMATTQREVKNDTNIVTKLTQKVDVKPKKEHKLALELSLPAVTPTINEFSPLITIQYLVQVSADTSAQSIGSDVDCEMTLLLGTVPIRQFLPPSYYPPNPTPPPPYPTPLPPQIGSGVVPGYGFIPQPVGQVSNPPYPSAPGVIIPKAPPLSYQDSMYGTNGTQLNTDENEMPFVPKYPVFTGLPVYNPSAPPS